MTETKSNRYNNTQRRRRIRNGLIKLEPQLIKIHNTRQTIMKTISDVDLIRQKIDGHLSFDHAMYREKYADANAMLSAADDCIRQALEALK